MKRPRNQTPVFRSSCHFVSHGFTIIELLVVVSIISFFIALLVPALSKAREAAKATQCLIQLRQSALAATLYANDHQGVMAMYFYDGVDEYRWGRRLHEMRYLSSYQAMVCPSAKQSPTLNWSWIYGGLVDIDVDDRISVNSGTPRYTYLSLLNLKSPSQYFFLGDSVYSDAGSSWFMRPIGSMHMNASQFTIHMLHGGSTALAYADGHASLSGEDALVAATKAMYKTNRIIYVFKDNARVQINP